MRLYDISRLRRQLLLEAKPYLVRITTLFFLHRMDRFCLICAICVLNLNDIGEVYSDIYLLNGAYYAMMIYVKGERR